VLETMPIAITTLRLRGAAADSPALRLRAARELGAADLAPALLPPAAVLVVRRIRDPLPGRFGGGGVRPHPEWERAVRDGLAAAARTAARLDGNGRVPHDADAVLFHDGAEMLACAVAARVRGELAGQWWWRAVIRRLGVPPGAADVGARDPAPFLLARPRDAPAAIALLARWGAAPLLARVLDAGGAAAVLRALAREHGLAAALAGPPLAGAEPGVTAAAIVRSGPGRAGHTPRAVSADVSKPTAPWCEWLPPGVDAEDIAPVVRALLGVALGLHVAPVRIRSGGAAMRADRWWREATGSDTGVRAPAGTFSQLHGAQRSPGADVVSWEGTEPTAWTGAKDAAGAGPAGTQPAADQAAIPEAADGALGDGVAEPASAAGVSPPKPPAAHDIAAPADDSQVAATVGPAPPAAASSATDDAVRTRAGGVLFLIHALRDLGLPGAPAAGWEVVEDGGPWAVLDLVARALLGRRFGPLAADPVWNVLARLAGRDSGAPERRRAVTPTAPGRVSDPSYRAPPEWMGRLADPGDDFAWTPCAGRLWLWSRRGYVVAHRRHRGERRRAALREVDRFLSGEHGPRRLSAAPPSAIPWRPPPALPTGCPPRLARWAAVVAPAVLRRVALGLGVDGAARSYARTARMADVVAVPGTLHVTASHVDLVMRLEDARLAVRRAGLDCDPGWLPAYGRVVAFHYR
jgi:hypothetical protein